MATVRISKELYENIIKSSKALFKNKRENLFNEMIRDTDYGQKIYDTIMAPYVPIIAQLPANFFLHTKELSFEISKTSFSVKFSVEKPWFHKTEKSSLISGIMYYNTHIKLQDTAPEWAEIKDKALEYERLQAEIQQQGDQFVANVSKILNAYSTLAPALKAWPPLWDLLDNNTKDRHREIVERKQNKPAAVDVDLNAMTSVVIAHKMGV